MVINSQKEVSSQLTQTLSTGDGHHSLLCVTEPLEEMTATSIDIAKLGMTSEKFSNRQMTVCSLKLYWTPITVYSSYYLILATHMGVICARVVISTPFR